MNYAEWKDRARAYVMQGVKPEEIHWQNDLLGCHSRASGNPEPAERLDSRLRGNDSLHVPRAFATLAEHVAVHTDPLKWELLYTALWRIAHSEKHLLELASDPLVSRLTRMHKAVTRDMHKMKAFVRFRQCRAEDNEPVFIAWHRPDHDTLRLTAPFFARRFSTMRWGILTPLASAYFDGATVEFGEGIPNRPDPPPDAMEDIWRAYYRSTFNPARIKLKMMHSEMPTRHWPTLPETRIINDMLREAPSRVEQMIKNSS